MSREKTGQKICFALLTSIFLMGGLSNAQTASISYTRDQISTPTDWGPLGATDIPQFDPTLGTLTSVQIDLSSTLQSTMTLRNNSTASSTIISGSVFVSLNANVASVNISVINPGDLPGTPLVISGSEEKQFEVNANKADSQTLSVPADDLSAFIGTGFLTYDWAAQGGFGLQALGGNTVAEVATFADAQLTIIYTYEIPRGTIIIEKQTDPDDDPTLFTFSGDIAGSIADNGQIVVADLVAGTYTSTELVPAGWTLTSITLDDGASASPSSGDVNTGMTTFNLDPGETVKATYTNTLPRGTIIIEKQTDPADNPTSFTFSGDVAGSIADNGQIMVTDLLPGTYTSTELVPAGWTLTSITLDDGASASPSSGDINTGTATFNLDPGETIKAIYSNTLQRGTIIIEKQTDPDNDPTSFTFSGDVAGSITDNGQIVVADLLPGTYTSTELVPAGWTLTSITLDDGASTTPSVGNINAGTATINLDPGETVKATYTNTLQRGTIIVEKQTDPDNDPTAFTFAGDVAGSIANNGQIVVADLLPGTYTSTELVPAGWILTSITLDDGASATPSFGDINTGMTTFNLDPGETVKATYSNTLQRGTIIIEKQTDPDNDPTAFTFAGDAAGSIADNDQIVVSDLLPGTYTATELVPAGWDLTAITLDDGASTTPSSGNINTGVVTFNLDPGETVKAIFTNTLQRGTIIVEKQTFPNDDPNLVTFTGDIAGAIADNGQIVVSDLLPGTYTTKELVPPGWVLTSITLDDMASATPSSGDTATGVATIRLDPGETVKAVFANIASSTIIIEKQTDPDGDPTPFTFNVQKSEDPSDPTQFTVITKHAADVIQGPVDPNDPNTFIFVGQAIRSIKDDNQIVVVDLIPGVYTASEVVPEGWTLTSITLDDGASALPSSGDINTGVTTFRLEPGETVKATYTNTLKRGTIIVEKQTDPDNDPTLFAFEGDAAGSIADNGQIVVADLLPGTYTSTELVPAGWDLTAITLDDGDSPTPSSADINTGKTTFKLDPGETVKAIYTNAVKRGTIIIEKQTLPSDDPTSFTFTGDIAGSIADNGQIVVADLLPGTYTSTELVPTGWAIQSITLDDGASATPSSGDANTGAITFQLDPGETVKAVVTNLALGTVIIEKQVECVNANEPPPVFTFTGDITGSIKPGERIVASALLPGTYVTTELPLDKWSLLNISLSDTNSSSTISADKTTGTVTFNVEPGETVKAIFTNSLPKYTIKFTAGPGGSIMSPGEGEFEYCEGETICIKAMADPLFDFVGWRGSWYYDIDPDCDDTPPPPGCYCVCGQPKPDCLKNRPPSCWACFVVDQDHELIAVFKSQVSPIFVNDDSPDDPAPNDPTESDPKENGTPEHPFDTIQEAIDVAKKGATVIVRSGYYTENIDFRGKAITVTSFDPNEPKKSLDYPVIDGSMQAKQVVTFDEGEGLETRLSGFVITGGYGEQAGGILCDKSSPTIENCLIVGNRAKSLSNGGGAVQCVDSHAAFVNCTLHGNFGGQEGAGFYAKNSEVVVLNSILWGNQPNEILSLGDLSPIVGRSNIAAGYAGDDNVDVDPLFKQAGRWEHALYEMVVAPDDENAIWINGDYHTESADASKAPAQKKVNGSKRKADVDTDNEPAKEGIGAYGGTG